jgi:hypothetical protein
MIRKKYDDKEIQIITEILALGFENGEFDSKYKENIDAVALICATTLRGIQMDFLFGNNDTCKAKYDLLYIAIDMIIDGLKSKQAQ